jgi:two-component system, OmpR family, phosphate regulon response regulator PhoB
LIQTDTRPTLLVVEDHVVTQALVEKAIAARRGSSIQVLCAANGKEGLELARQHRPDLVLLDWMMPDYGGEWFLREQAQVPSIADVPVLVHTALNEEKVHEILKCYPVVKGIVHKPLVPSKLCDKILPLLKRAQPGTPSPPGA